MALFSINPKYARSVRRTVQATVFAGPWEWMPVEPGSQDQQLWIHDDNDALKVRFAVRWDALQPVRKAA